jgi:parvulin-like peptidyl-prolyl isomerase
LGHEFRLRSQEALENTFGSEFARTVFGLDRENWSGPVRSGYGLHLVWVAEIRPERLPALEDVRARVAGALIHEERERRYGEMLARLRQQYDVRVERTTAEVAEQPS